MEAITHRAARALGAALFALAAGAAQAQDAGQATDPASAARQHAEISRGDPPRWYREDTTMQARMQTLRKEIGAALNEALYACRQMPAAERAGCVREAREIYRRDLGGMHAQLMEK